jgi:RNA polymerase sigma factor (sigma-70 family)
VPLVLPGRKPSLVEQAFRRYGAQIYRYLLRRIGDHYEAEELTQRVFMDAAVALSDSNPPDSVLAWLYAVAERRFIDELRRRRRAGVLSASVTTLAVRSRAEPFYGRVATQALKDSIGRLPPEQRRVVVMKILEGRSFAEIARQVGASPNACKMRLSRALRQLRDDLEREGLEP